MKETSKKAKGADQNEDATVVRLIFKVVAKALWNNIAKILQITKDQIGFLDMRKGLSISIEYDMQTPPSASNLFYLYYGDQDQLLKHSAISINPLKGKQRLVRFDQAEDVEKFGNWLLITNGDISGTALVTPIELFKQYDTDKNPNGYTVEGYDIIVTLKDKFVKVEYWVTLKGTEYGNRMDSPEKVYPEVWQEGPWWNLSSESTRDNKRAIAAAMSPPLTINGLTNV